MMSSRAIIRTDYGFSLSFLKIIPRSDVEDRKGANR